MNENEDVKPKSGEKNSRKPFGGTSDLESTIDELQRQLATAKADGMKYEDALDELRKSYRQWRTGEQSQIGLCNDVDRILKTVDQ